MIYEYICDTCGEIEIEHPMSDAAWDECPKCGDSINRVISCAPRFILKGRGWNSDGYANGVHDTNVE